MEREKKGRKYEKPKVIYRKRMETLAAVCDSGRTPTKVCRKSAPACEKTRA
ncbi:MAG: hypothetical protein ACE5G7_06230 [Candidatus Hydrothermarchaeaceae archaeon]